MSSGKCRLCRDQTPVVTVWTHFRVSYVSVPVTDVRSGRVARGRLGDAGGRAASADLREADHRDGVVRGDVTVVELAEERGHVLGTPDLRIVVLDLARRQVRESLHLDLVD